MTKHFTVDEANALLPTVRPVVERMVVHRRELVTQRERQQELGGITQGNGGGFNPRLPAEIQEAVETAAGALQEDVDELAGLGVQVKDLDTGLVDFPSIRDGQEVLLCWQLGEDEIGWWHTPEAGFGGRQPI